MMTTTLHLVQCQQNIFWWSIGCCSVDFDAVFASYHTSHQLNWIAEFELDTTKVRPSCPAFGLRTQTSKNCFRVTCVICTYLQVDFLRFWKGFGKWEAKHHPYPNIIVNQPLDARSAYHWRYYGHQKVTSFEENMRNNKQQNWLLSGFFWWRSTKMRDVWACP